MEDQRGGRETATRRRLLPARKENDQRRQAGKQLPADGSSSRGLGRGERKAEPLLQAETRRQQLLPVARAKRERAGRSVFPERSSLSAVCSDFSRVFLSSAPNSPTHPPPLSLRARLPFPRVCSFPRPFSRDVPCFLPPRTEHARMAPAFLDLGRIGRQIDVFRTPCS